MPRLTETQKENCSFIYAYLLPRLTSLELPAYDEAYELEDDTGVWRIRSHWFDRNSTDPLRPPMLEVTIIRTSPQRGKSLHYWFYRKGSGNDIHPEYNQTGWMVHAWVG